jgi:hypothetical protein
MTSSNKLDDVSETDVATATKVCQATVSKVDEMKKSSGLLTLLLSCMWNYIFINSWHPSSNDFKSVVWVHDGKDSMVSVYTLFVLYCPFPAINIIIHFVHDCVADDPNEILALCRQCLTKVHSVLAPTNVNRLRVLDRAFDAAITASLWEDAAKFGHSTLQPFRYTHTFW